MHICALPRLSTGSREADAAARGVISDAGYGDRFLHRTGHGLGIDIHEAPYITGTSELPLAAGNVFSIEPSISAACSACGSKRSSSCGKTAPRSSRNCPGSEETLWQRLPNL